MACAVSSLAALALPAETARHRISRSAGGTIEVTRLTDTLVVGNVAVRIDRDVLEFQSVCIQDDARGYGAGTDTVRLLLAAATPMCRLATAFAPADNGLAVYFWTRMGFRPCFGHGARGLRFERELG
jgi:N-acetylglutamate synthase-like GNAT family acetyltransferase